MSAGETPGDVDARATTHLAAVARRWSAAVLVLAVVGSAILFLRRPGFFLGAEFYAEEGTIWFARAWQAPFEVFAPFNGTFHFLQGLVALAALALPLTLVPLFFHVVSALIQLAPPLFLASERCAGLVADPRLRLGFALLWLLFPNSYEAHANLTNAHWHLGALAVLMVLAEQPRGRLRRGLVYFVVALAGLSVGHALLLLPIVAARWFARRERWLLASMIVTAMCALAQVLAIAASPERVEQPLGASVERFFHILGVQVFASPLLGGQRSYRLYQAGWLAPGALTIGLGIAGSLVLMHGVFRLRTLEQRLWIGWALLIVAAGLASPKVSGEPTAWGSLAIPGGANRYFYFASLAFVAVLAHDALRASSWLRRAPWALALTLVLALGVTSDFEQPRFPDEGFAVQCEAWDRAPPGAEVEFRITPPGWRMRLLKR